jgi:alkylation response protein AidB-like acyl-CoA dehydrogenase
MGNRTETATRKRDVEPLDMVRSLKPEVRRRAREIEQARRLPADLARRMAEAGLFRLYLPRSVGGDERSPVEVTALFAEMAEADASVAWCLMIGVNTGLLSAWLAPDAARAVFSDPDIITASAVAPTGRAVLDGDDYIVTGRWAWGSGAENSAWFSGGVLVEGPDGAKQHRLAFFPAADVRLLDTWRAAGLCGTGSLDFEVEGIRVPRALVVPILGTPAVDPAPLYRAPLLGLLGAGQASVALGNAKAALAALERIVIEKRPQNQGRAAAERHTVQAEFALAQGRLAAARALLDEALGAAWDHTLRGDAWTIADRARLRLACTFGVRSAEEVTRPAYDLGGGGAVYLDSELQRRYRDACVLTHHRTVGSQSLELIGSILLDQPTDTMML